LTKTLVANLLVPDNEVWVSPLTFAERTAEDRGTQPTTGNSDYAAALDIYLRYHTTATQEEFGRGFECWLRERLNSAKAPNRA
jgi:hypothetical protein